MRINIYKDQFQSAELLGLTGTDREPDKPAALEDKISWLRVGAVLSPVSLKRKNTLTRRINNSFSLHEELLDLAGFCEKNHLDCPQAPRKFILRPASHEEAGLFYSQMGEDERLGVVGHLRMDFGDGRLHHTWRPHNDDQFNTPEFKAAFQEFVDEMRVRGPLQSEAAMHRWCYGYPEGEIGREQVGFAAETENYRFCLRCTADRSDYSYVYCYDLNQQRLAMGEKQLGLTEAGLQKLRDTADPAMSHSYDWYVAESYLMSDEQFIDGLSLEDAIQRYTACEDSSKRLGITKDGIAVVDLVIRWDGREWISEDYLKSESFKNDPVVAEAAAQIRQALEGQTQGMEMGGLADERPVAAAARDKFQLWLELGHAPFTVWQGEKALVTLSRLEKMPSVDYLYRIAATGGNSISWEDVYFQLLYLRWFERRTTRSLEPKMTEEPRLLPAQRKVYQEQAQIFLERIGDIDQVGRDIRKNMRGAYLFDGQEEGLRPGTYLPGCVQGLAQEFITMRQSPGEIFLLNTYALSTQSSSMAAISVRSSCFL